MDKHLHIVTHEVPWPVDYGGVVDLFYKIKTLHQAGVQIHLHCFTQNNNQQNMLNRYCVSVQYYPRKQKMAALLTGLPYIVGCRSDKKLLLDLQQDNHPIFLDGIPCTYLLYKGFLHGRKVFVRPHNIETDYYQKLAKCETHPLKKLYYLSESMLLKKYERKLSSMATFWPVSEADTSYYTDTLSAKNVAFLPVFIPWEKVKSEAGKGSFCLYHGNLEINENARAAEWLLDEVFSTLKIPFVVAGHNPSPQLQALAHRHPHTCIVINPSEHEMQDLVKKAQINIIPSFNSTGVKLKLINALFNGRHCLVNVAAAKGSGVENLCHIAKDARGFQSAIKILFEEPFTSEEVTEREETLLQYYNNTKNAAQLSSWIY